MTKLFLLLGYVLLATALTVLANTLNPNRNLLAREISQDEKNSPTGTPSSNLTTKVSYEGSQLWKVNGLDKDVLKLLVELREQNAISMWGGNKTCLDILVKPSVLEDVDTKLNEKNVTYQVLIKNLQRAIEEENPPVNHEETDERRGHKLTWNSYHRLEDIDGYLSYLAETYPNLCSVETIGNSVQGRPIQLLKISNGKPGNRAVWIDGGIHAREWISPATVTYIINQLVLNHIQGNRRLENVDWHIVPVLNPDGYEHTHQGDRLWRKNRSGGGFFCSGVDLNRNFGYQWGGKGASKNPCLETYGGSGPFSEPETAAVRGYFARKSADWRVYLSFHSYGQYILYPWGYDRLVPPDHHELDTVGRKAAEAMKAQSGSHYTVGGAANLLYPAAGGSDDWAKGAMKIKYSYTIELRDNGRYGFVLPSKFIIPTAKEAYAAAEYIANVAAAS